MTRGEAFDEEKVPTSVLATDDFSHAEDASPSSTRATARPKSTRAEEFDDDDAMTTTR
jgi:hypothetical protein